jgi:hypothetical protein
MTLNALNNTAQKYRKELLMIPFLALREHVLQFMAFYPNIQWKEVIGQMLGNFELRPHDGQVNTQSGITINARELEVYVGDVITDEDPEALRKSILGQNLLNNAQPAKHPLEAQILAAIMAEVSKKLARTIWNASRNPAGTTTAELYNGFDTITAAEIAANNISTGNGNLISLGSITASNAMDKLTDLYYAADVTMREKNTVMFVPYGLYDLAQKQMRDDYGAANFNQSESWMYVLGSDKRCRIVPQIGKSGSGYIHMAEDKVFQVGTDIASDAPTILVKEIDNPWKARFVTKMAFGVQFASIQKEHLMVGTITPIS